MQIRISKISLNYLTYMNECKATPFFPLGYLEAKLRKFKKFAT